MSKNRECVMNWYKALETGDLELFQSVQHDDVIIDVSGHSAVSGRFVGLEKLMNEVVPAVFAGINEDKFQFCTKLKIMAEDDGCIAAIMEADGEAANGRRYDQRYAQFFHFRDGKISRIVEFFDTELAKDTILANAEKVQPSGPFEL